MLFQCCMILSQTESNIYLEIKMVCDPRDNRGGVTNSKKHSIGKMVKNAVSSVDLTLKFYPYTISTCVNDNMRLGILILSITLSSESRLFQLRSLNIQGTVPFFQLDTL